MTEPETGKPGGLMKIKVKTLGNTVYDLEMKPDVSCSLHPYRRQSHTSHASDLRVSFAIVPRGQRLCESAVKSLLYTETPFRQTLCD